MQIKTSTVIKNLRGEVIKTRDKEGGETDYTIGQAISEVLLEAPEGGKMKMFILATKCFNDKSVEVDEADLSLIKSAVEKTKALSNLYTGQILVHLESLKDEPKKDNKK